MATNCNECSQKEGCSSKETCNLLKEKKQGIQKIIGVMSGKGGVGKSSVSVLLAQALRAEGYQVGLLDADITGPSIPRLMGLSEERAFSDGERMIPVIHKSGIKTMSLNYLIQNEEDPVIWRGPIIANMVEQFLNEVSWGELDYLLVDMPPGTGDVALTVLQSYPMDGLVMVTLPQDMVSMIVSKAVNMAQKLQVPILGVIENMSHMVCPDCGKKIFLYDNEEEKDYFSTYGIQKLGALPMTKEILRLSEDAHVSFSDGLKEILAGILDGLK